MMDRRRFFGTIASIGIAQSQARAILFSKRIGSIAYCRASTAEWLRLASEICPETAFIGEVDAAGMPPAAGAVFLGSKGTLVLGQNECRVLP